MQDSPTGRLARASDRRFEREQALEHGVERPEDRPHVRVAVLAGELGEHAPHQGDREEQRVGVGLLHGPAGPRA